MPKRLPLPVIALAAVVLTAAITAPDLHPSLRQLGAEPAVVSIATEPSTHSAPPAARTPAPAAAHAPAVAELRGLSPDIATSTIAAARHITPGRTRPSAKKTVTKEPSQEPSQEPVKAPKKAVAPRAASATVTVGHYIRSITGRPRDATTMCTLGAYDAAHNVSRTSHLILLDLGGQWHNGVMLSTTPRWISYPALVRALTGYLDCYHAHQHSGAPAVIAIGTNNDLTVSTATGAAWASQVINPLRAAAKVFDAITVAGANDIEPDFAAGPGPTRRWLSGYLASTPAPFVFNGSADGCSWTRTRSRCAGLWTSADLVMVAGAMAPSRTLVLPQIYNPEMAGQWALLSHELAVSHHQPMNIVGPLTENRACTGDPHCPTMPTSLATSRLRRELARRHAPASAVRSAVDLDVR